ncbi:MAG: hypothetical protein AAF203_00420, partial [Pseudomonadota bacterium]
AVDQIERDLPAYAVEVSADLAASGTAKYKADGLRQMHGELITRQANLKSILARINGTGKGPQ